MKFFILLSFLFLSACMPPREIVSTEDYLRFWENHVRADNLDCLKIHVNEARCDDCRLYISGYVQNVSEEKFAYLRSIDRYNDRTESRAKLDEQSTLPTQPRLVLLWECFCLKKHGEDWLPIFEEVDYRNVFWCQWAIIQPRAKVPFELIVPFPGGYMLKDFKNSLFKLSYPMQTRDDLSPSCSLNSNEFRVKFKSPEK